MTLINSCYGNWCLCFLYASIFISPVLIPYVCSISIGLFWFTSSVCALPSMNVNFGRSYLIFYLILFNFVLILVGIHTASWLLWNSNAGTMTKLYWLARIYTCEDFFLSFHLLQQHCCRIPSFLPATSSAQACFHTSFCVVTMVLLVWRYLYFKLILNKKKSLT